MLIKAGADVNFVDEFGRTPLQIVATHSNKITVLRLLIDAGADVNRGGFIEEYFQGWNVNEQLVYTIIMGKKFDSKFERGSKMFYAVKWALARCKNWQLFNIILDKAINQCSTIF
jgi:ankyrin repeat protein